MAGSDYSRSISVASSDRQVRDRECEDCVKTRSAKPNLTEISPVIRVGSVQVGEALTLKLPVITHEVSSVK